MIQNKLEEDKLSIREVMNTYNVMSENIRIKKYNDYDSLIKCYGSMLEYYDSDDYTTPLFYISENLPWRLEEHEIAITLCCFLPKDYLELYLDENMGFRYYQMYKLVYEFLQNK